MDWIRVEGDRLVDDAGRGVTLAGVGLGGWLNMENFITGYPGTESQQRRALLAALGVDMEDVGLLLEEQGVASFRASFDELLEALEKKAHDLSPR